MSVCIVCESETTSDKVLPRGELNAGKTLCEKCAEDLAALDHPKVRAKGAKSQAVESEGVG